MRFFSGLIVTVFVVESLETGSGGSGEPPNCGVCRECTNNPNARCRLLRLRLSQRNPYDSHLRRTFGLNMPIPQNSGGSVRSSGSSQRRQRLIGDEPQAQYLGSVRSSGSSQRRQRLIVSPPQRQTQAQNLGSGGASGFSQPHHSVIFNQPQRQPQPQYQGPGRGFTGFGAHHDEARHSGQRLGGDQGFGVGPASGVQGIGNPSSGAYGSVGTHNRGTRHEEPVYAFTLHDLMAQARYQDLSGFGSHHGQPRHSGRRLEGGQGTSFGPAQQGIGNPSRGAPRSSGMHNGENLVQEPVGRVGDLIANVVDRQFQGRNEPDDDPSRWSIDGQLGRFS